MMRPLLHFDVDIGEIGDINLGFSKSGGRGSDPLKALSYDAPVTKQQISREYLERCHSLFHIEIFSL